MEDSAHFNAMLEEQGILPEWADRAVAEPDKIEDQSGHRERVGNTREARDRLL